MVDDDYAGKLLRRTNPQTHSGERLPEVIPCARRCRGGGLMIRYLVETLIDARKEGHETWEFCNGKQARSGGYSGGDSLNDTITITYK